MITWYHFKDSREVGHYLNRWWQFRVSEKTTYSSPLWSWDMTSLSCDCSFALSCRLSGHFAERMADIRQPESCNACSDGKSIKRNQSITFPLNIFELLLPRNCCYITSCMRMACWMSVVWKHTDRWREQCWTVEREPISCDGWQLFLHYLSAGIFRP